MPELSPAILTLAGLCLVLGILVGWFVRNSRSRAEKAAISAGWQAQMDATRNEHRRLSEQNKSLMEQVNHLRSSSRDSGNKTQELAAALKEALGRRDELQRDIKAVRNNLESAVSEKHRLKSDLSQREAKAASATEALRERDERIEKLRKELKNWQDRLPPLITRFRERNEEANRLEIELNEANERIAGLETVFNSDETHVGPLAAEELLDSVDASNEQITDGGIDEAIVEASVDERTDEADDNADEWVVRVDNTDDPTSDHSVDDDDAETSSDRNVVVEIDDDDEADDSIDEEVIDEVVGSDDDPVDTDEDGDEAGHDEEGDLEGEEEVEVDEVEDTSDAEEPELAARNGHDGYSEDHDGSDDHDGEHELAGDDENDQDDMPSPDGAEHDDPPAPRFDSQLESETEAEIDPEIDPEIDAEFDDTEENNHVVSFTGGLRDNLKAIKGVGPAIEKTLNELGIFRYAQVAEMTNYDIERIANRLKGFRGRIEREDWIGQARLLDEQKAAADPVESRQGEL